MKDKILGGILGLAVGDALGVPVEFQSRESLRRNPVTDMRGYGTHNQPPGTWSDDTSLTLCLLDSLEKKCDEQWAIVGDLPKPDYTDIMHKFLSWAYKGKYTAHNEVFDIGIATRKALQRFRDGTEPLRCGGTSEQDNGNGSLMRMLPIVFYLDALIRNWQWDWAAPQGRKNIWLVDELSTVMSKLRMLDGNKRGGRQNGNDTHHDTKTRLNYRTRSGRGGNVWATQVVLFEEIR